jgi:hypothetical protein
MSSHTPMPATGAMSLDDPVRQGLADPGVGRKLMLLIRAALGRFPTGVTIAQRASEAEEMVQEVSKHAIASARSFDPQRGSLLHSRTPGPSRPPKTWPRIRESRRGDRSTAARRSTCVEKSFPVMYL